MKKLAILTSILALTACGGGSGSGGGSAPIMPDAPVVPENPDVPVVPEARPGTVSDEVIDSNTYVTGMLSEIGYSEEDGTTIDVFGTNRSATRKEFKHNGKLYKSYDLSDVDFTMSDEGFGGVVKFIVDNNKKITGFEIVDEADDFVFDGANILVKDDRFNNPSSEIYVENGELKGNNGTINFDDTTGIWTYDSNSEGMDGSFKIIDNEIFTLYDGDELVIKDGKLVSNTESLRVIDNKIYEVDTYNRTDDKGFEFGGLIKDEDGYTEATLTYFSAAKANDMKLRYSDFGYYQLAADGDVDRPVSIIGGYDIKRIDPSDVKSDTIFTAKAVGSVIAIRGGNGSGKVMPLESSGDATLTFKAGEETYSTTLNANFDDWYNILYTKKGDNDGTVVFTPGKDIENTDVDYLLISDRTNPLTVSGEDIRYYGDKNNATEVVGLIQVRDCGGAECTSDYDQQQEVRMNLSFGGIANK